MLKKIMKKIFYRSISSKNINYKTLQSMVKQKNAILIDVRSYQEYEEEHLIGAICIPLYSLRKTILEMIPDKQKLIIVYCASGGRSMQAQEILEDLGYEKVYNLKDGLNSI